MSLDQNTKAELAILTGIRLPGVTDDDVLKAMNERAAPGTRWERRREPTREEAEAEYQRAQERKEAWRAYRAAVEAYRPAVVRTRDLVRVLGYDYCDHLRSGHNGEMYGWLLQTAAKLEGKTVREQADFVVSHVRQPDELHQRWAAAKPQGWGWGLARPFALAWGQSWDDIHRELPPPW